MNKLAQGCHTHGLLSNCVPWDDHKWPAGWQEWLLACEIMITTKENNVLQFVIFLYLKNKITMYKYIKPILVTLTLGSQVWTFVVPQDGSWRKNCPVEGFEFDIPGVDSDLVCM